MLESLIFFVFSFSLLKCHCSDVCLFCPRYEDEINKRTAAENEFVGLKKVSELARVLKAPFLGMATTEGSRASSGTQGLCTGCGSYIHPYIFGNEVFDEGSCSENVLAWRGSYNVTDKPSSNVS